MGDRKIAAKNLSFTVDEVDRKEVKSGKKLRTWSRKTTIIQYGTYSDGNKPQSLYKVKRELFDKDTYIDGVKQSEGHECQDSYFQSEDPDTFDESLTLVGNAYLEDKYEGGVKMRSLKW